MPSESFSVYLTVPEIVGAPDPLEAARAKVAERIDRELERRLLWDWACAVWEGEPENDLFVCRFPENGTKVVCRDHGDGEPVEYVGHSWRVVFEATETRATWTLRGVA